MTNENTDGPSKHTAPSRLRIDHGGLDAAREHREDLEALAETDLPAGKWAKRLLRLIDEQDNGGGVQ